MVVPVLVPVPVQSALHECRLIVLKRGGQLPQLLLVALSSDEPSQFAMLIYLVHLIAMQAEEFSQHLGSEHIMHIHHTVEVLGMQFLKQPQQSAQSLILPLHINSYELHILSQSLKQGSASHLREHSKLAVLVLLCCLPYHRGQHRHIAQG